MELSAANTLIGLSVIEVFNVFRDVAPSLADCRASTDNDPKIDQGLLDAEVMAGILAVIVAGGAAVMTKSPLPILLSAAGLLLITQYYRAVLRSRPV